MAVLRVAVCSLVVCALAVPAWAQEPSSEGTTDATTTAATPDGSQIGQPPQIPQPRPLPGLPVATTTATDNVFKLVASDFRRFFSKDTAKVFGFVSIAAVAAAPWDREGINNGFNIPTTLFESGNLLGQFAFQAGAGFASYGLGKAFGSHKLSMVGRDVVRAQILSQVLVQTVKHTVRRERPDFSNKGAFPSGHSASAFATATVLHRHYGWKVGVPAYALGSYVALARMAWNRHHATDVVMGAGFGLAAARTVTMSVAKTKFSVGVQPERGGASVNFTLIPDP
jgi:membrane-associated phospholipid phosphatase